jgi:hypothetical protein
VSACGDGGPPGAGPPIRPGSTAPSAGATSTAASEAADGSGSVDGSTKGSADGSGSPDGSVSIAMIGDPTSTVLPSEWKIFVTRPAHFAGISTAAFAVSTSTMGWFCVTRSPSATNHFRISPSVSPSPRSGSLNSFTRDIGSPPE